MPKQPTLLILADDFTGAMDTAAQFGKCGISTVVTVKEEILENLPLCSVLAINMASRHTLPHEAKKLYTQILSDLKHIPFIYFKTDSALRGNLSAVFSAALADEESPVFFFPAYPAAKRWTKNSLHYIDGALLENSIFSLDPRSPQRESNVPKLLNRDFTFAVQCVEELAEKQNFSTNTVYIVENISAAEMRASADFLRRNNLLARTAGCAGFAEFLPEALSLEQQSMPDETLREPVLFLSGSANAITFAQLTQAAQDGYTLIKIPRSFLLMPLDSQAEAFAAFTEKIKLLMNKGSSVVIAAATGSEDMLCLSQEASSAQFQDNLEKFFAAVAYNLVKKVGVRNLAIFGGDTALAVLEAIGCKYLLALGEIAAGVPRAKSDGESFLQIVTKSGGLGPVDIVHKIDCALQGRS